jgi:HD-GYP domain-containing protein (c-di-GMP phosphodiesterase class II)
VAEKKEEVRFVTPDWAQSTPPVRERRELDSQVILSLHRLIRAAQVYGIDAVAVDQSISQYLRLVNPFILAEGGIALEVTNEGILLNTRKIRGKPEDYGVLKSFMRSMIDCRIGRLAVLNPLDEWELKEFISLLGALKEGVENNHLHLMRELSARKIDSINAERLELEEEPLAQTPEKKRHARELYFAAVGIVREIMENGADGKAFNMRKAKRLIQELVTVGIDDDSLLLGLAMIKDYGQYLHNHSVNVALYSIALGNEVGLPRKDIVHLGIAGLFHDVGRTSIPQSILSKSDGPTGKEWDVIEKHPIWGVEVIVQANGWNETTARMIETAFEHHMKEGGTGYPKLASGRELTLFGKIIAIADFYDNVVRSASYRLFPVFSDRITALLLERSGRDFDPTLVKLFIRSNGFFPVGTLVALEDGRMGIVEASSRKTKLIDRPRILLIRFQAGEYREGGMLDLAERDDETGKYRNTISRPLDPNEYQVNVAELLLFG